MLPDVRALLPSEAKRSLVEYIRDRLPAYTYADALAEMPADFDGYSWCILSECYDTAVAEIKDTSNESTPNPEVR